MCAYVHACVRTCVGVYSHGHMLRAVYRRGHVVVKSARAKGAFFMPASSVSTSDVFRRMEVWISLPCTAIQPYVLAVHSLLFPVQVFRLRKMRKKLNVVIRDV